MSEMTPLPPQTRLCTICVRGGSKGVPAKNIRDIAGKPLFVHSVDQARATGLFESVGLSSDSDAILEMAGRYEVDHLVKRPAELATDTAPKLPVIRHCVETVERNTGIRYDVMVDLDATSPLRLPEDITATVRLLAEPGVDNVITGTPARRSPYFNMVEIATDGGVKLCKPMVPPPARRQDAPACYDMNASIYSWNRDGFWSGGGLFGPRARLHVMPEERSIDIDSEFDWRIVSMLLAEREARTR